MSYLTSHFITLSRPMSFKYKNTKKIYGGSAGSTKNSKDSFLYTLKDFKQKSLQGPCKINNTPPLVLFINLLMKDGKKTSALRVLSMTLSLFKARVSKIKLQKHASSLKKRQNFYKYFYDSGGMPWKGDALQIPFSKNTLANYSIKASCFFPLLSKKSGTSQVVFPWFLNYKKTFPFISNFSLVFDDFYKKKRFFSGRFLNLKQYPLIKKNVQENTKHLFGALKKRKSTFLKKTGKGFKNNNILAGESTLCIHSNHQALNDFAKQNNTTPILKKNNVVANSKNCLWYKTLAKKPSWDKLTVAQKNTFLYILYKAISNVKPPLECRTKRIGGSNKQIPSQVSEHRQWGIAIRWIIEVAQNEFSKKKNKIKLYNPIKTSILNNILKASGNVQDKSKIPRGSLLTKKTVQKKQNQLGSWAFEEKTLFLSSLLQKKSKAGGLKVDSPKTRFYSFCFFLAESLENAYYKTGPAMQKRNLWVETALANRAFLRYRWW